MARDESLVIVGASARAAAFSALRGGFKPWCADLFSDLDLERQCPATVIERSAFPNGFELIVSGAPAGPWMYTGGMEHHPDLVDRIAAVRPLWGNGGNVLRAVRSPERVYEAFCSAGLPCPALAGDANSATWLSKPRRGGRLIEAWRGEAVNEDFYVQEHIDGEPHGVVYLGDRHGCRLVGWTRQLVGESWLHATTYQYCGSIGPLTPSAACRDMLCRLGEVIWQSFGMRGLFGIDCVLRDDVPWPVEINPRYTASVEVLEYASGLPLMAVHGQVFESGSNAILISAGDGAVIGKAILYASRPMTFPDQGPWVKGLKASPAITTLPEFADIPAPGTRIEAQGPILTLFAKARSAPECVDRLQAIACELDRALSMY